MASEQRGEPDVERGAQQLHGTYQPTIGLRASEAMKEVFSVFLIRLLLS
jgi:hypothetical protein